MNYYETLYIIHPALEAGRLKDIISSVEGNVNKLGGETLAIELWGKRKLSYFIDKQKYGTYVLYQFNGKDRCANELATELEHNPNILAYLTTKIDSTEVKKIEEDLDTQIAGKTRDSDKPSSKKNTTSEDSKDSDASETMENLASKEETKEKVDNENVENKKESVESLKEEILEEKLIQDSEETNNENAEKKSAENIEE